MSNIEPHSPLSPARRLERLTRRAVELHAGSKAKNTRDAYARDAAQYGAFCGEHRLEPWPATAATLARWIAEMADRYKYTTIERKVYAVSSVHRRRFDTICVNEEIKDVLKGLKKERAQEKERKRRAKALTADIAAPVLASVKHCGKTTHNEEAVDRRALRDRALLLLSFAGAFRISELLTLDKGDLEIDAAGLVVILSSSKTSTEEARIGIERWVKNPDDPAAKGSLCPVRALEAWLDELAAAGIESGRIFRRIDAGGAIATDAGKDGNYLSRTTANRIIKDAAARAGFDASLFSTHSGRRGHITQAYRMSVPEQEITRTSRHKTLSVQREYEEEGNVFQGSASRVRI